jgi:hypothetical protein
MMRFHNEDGDGMRMRTTVEKKERKKTRKE